MNSININYWDEIPNNYTGYIKHTNGMQAWYKNGKWHREDGPAVIYADGTQSWCKNGKLHRENGPAVICANGTQSWCKNGKLHREDGPVVIRADGRQGWWLNGDYYTRDNYYKELYKRGIITEQELFLELL